MKIYHYTTLAGARAIVRLRKRGYLEFILGAQDQSGHPTGAYFSLKSPDDVGSQDQPVSRYFGVKGFDGEMCYAFELDVPAEWGTGLKSDAKWAHISKLTGDRGGLGIVVYMVKAGSYADPMGDSDDVLTMNNCIAIPITLLVSTWQLESGAKAKARNETAFNPNAKKMFV